MHYVQCVRCLECVQCVQCVQCALCAVCAYENIVESKEKAKDLGILIDNDAKFKSQRAKAITKTSNKCSWILRTFRTREIYHLHTLWNSLVRPHQDYGAQLWGPAGDKGDLQAQEGPLRAFTKRFKGLKDLNYWQRLKASNMNSYHRRLERYKIFYIFKSMNGMVPSLGLKWKYSDRKGRYIEIPRITGTVMSVKTLKEKCINIEGSKLFNSLPKILRNFE